MRRLFPNIVSIGIWIGVAACESAQPGMPFAGPVTEQNADLVLLEGPLADGAVGDTYLRNEHVIAIIERPGRVFSVTPYGGNIIDIAPVSRGARQDVLGETIPFTQLGLTADFNEVRVVNDGINGEAAVVEARGTFEIWDFLNIQSFMPAFLAYQEDDRGRPMGLLQFDPRKPLPLLVRAVYTLERDARFVAVRYYVENAGTETLDLRMGFGVDIRGQVDPFAPGRGYTEPGVDLNDIEGLLTGNVDSPYLAFFADDYALGVKSRDFLGLESVPRLSAAILGIALVMVGHSNLVSILDPEEHSFVIEPGEERGYGFDLFVGRDVGEVFAFSEKGDEVWGEIGGVVREPDGTTVAGARVAAIDPDTGDVISSFVTGSDGRFDGELPPGTYHVSADELSHAEDPGRRVDVTAGGAAALDIVLEPPARIDVMVELADDPFSNERAAGPCRVLLAGPSPERRGGVCGTSLACGGVNEPFRHEKRWELDGNEPYMRHYRWCDTRRPDDEPFVVVPGRYVVFVSRGPEYDTLARLVDAAPGEVAEVKGVIHRVVDSDGWAASELHVHQIRSPDSMVQLLERTLSFAAAGVDFFATTDHDAVTDLRPLIELYGLDRELAAVPGVEVSTIDIGHFNTFPIEPMPGLQYGAPPDWAGGRERPSPAAMFQRMRDRGGAVVQVNHPRMSGSYFHRLNLIYDFEAGTITAAPEDGLTAELMLMEPGTELFTPDFDLIEIYNSTRDHAVVIRDWFNLLSMGVTPTATAVSDTHAAFVDDPGDPRTYAAVTVDRPDPVSAAEVIGSLAAGHAFCSSGPILRVTAASGAASAGFGELLTPVSGDVTLTIAAETAAWFELNRLEVFLTRTYDDPLADADAVGDPVPDLVVDLTPVTVERPNGGTALRYDAEVVLDEALLADGDGWVVVRVRGIGEGMYPVSLQSGGTQIDPEADTAEEYASFTGGREPLAMGNPVFLDRDGNGVYNPPYPLR